MYGAHCRVRTAIKGMNNDCDRNPPAFVLIMSAIEIRAHHFLMPLQTSRLHNIINVDTSCFFSFGYNLNNHLSLRLRVHNPASKLQIVGG